MDQREHHILAGEDLHTHKLHAMVVGHLYDLVGVYAINRSAGRAKRANRQRESVSLRRRENEMHPVALQELHRDPAPCMMV